MLDKIRLHLLGLSILSVMCASCGPHMDNQASIKPYERQMPNMPVGTVPTTGRLETLTLNQPQSSPSATNAPTAIADGRIYYGYYCLMCHGEKGDGNGLVGQSYVPKPTDLTSPTIAQMSDGQLLYNMLHGFGHDPVLNQTVLPEHRRPIVLFVRSLRRVQPGTSKEMLAGTLRSEQAGDMR